MADVDSRSSSSAYATKPNIVMPASATQAAAAEERAATHEDDHLKASGGAAGPPTTNSRAGAVNTKTSAIRRTPQSFPGP